MHVYSKSTQHLTPQDSLVSIVFLEISRPSLLLLDTLPTEPLCDLHDFHCIMLFVILMTTVEPLIKDTLNKGHFPIHQPIYSGNVFMPLKEDNLSIMDKMIHPNVSIIGGSTVYI